MGQKINFILPAETASGATGGIVVGDFNNWNEQDATPLKVQKDGSLKASVTLEAGKAYQYRYFLNDGRWVNDENASSSAFDPVFNVENCVVFVKETIKTSKTVSEKKSTDKPAAKKINVSAEKTAKSASVKKEKMTKAVDKETKVKTNAAATATASAKEKKATGKKSAK